MDGRSLRKALKERQKKHEEFADSLLVDSEQKLNAFLADNPDIHLVDNPIKNEDADIIRAGHVSICENYSDEPEVIGACAFYKYLEKDKESNKKLLSAMDEMLSDMAEKVLMYKFPAYKVQNESAGGDDSDA